MTELLNAIANCPPALWRAIIVIVLALIVALIITAGQIDGKL